jgi:formate dehydrogenase major subunit
LKWLVVRDFQVTETADFWRDAPEIARGEIKPEDIQTEVFFFPACAHTEKDGTFTNTQRLLQWHHKAIEAKGDTRSELEFIFKLGKRLKELYADEYDQVRNWPIRDLTWDYPTINERGEPDAQAVLMEINGYTWADKKLVEGFADLKEDGSTASGCWIYSGAFKHGVNQTMRRKPLWEQNALALEWGWAWPKNRRVLYNRASADPEGKPWSEQKKLIWWDEEKKTWTGDDEPDFINNRPPSYRPEPGAKGKDAIPGDLPFIMQTDTRGWLFVPSGLKDGPLPTHYEPMESVVQNPIYAQQCNPDRMEWRLKDNSYHQAYRDPRFPYLITTYRLTEHHTAGGMSRWLSWLSELQPEMFCEVSPELAAERNLRNGGWATIRTLRAEIEARVLVTRRLAPVKTKAGLIHQIGLPYHWSSKGLVRGDAANDLIPFIADPNVSIQESKAFTANIEPGRSSAGRRLITTGQFVPSVNGNKKRDIYGPPKDAREHEVKHSEGQEGNS